MKKEIFSKEYVLLFCNINWLQKRCVAAIKAKEIGYGGVAEVIRATGLDKSTINKGKNDLISFSCAIKNSMIWAVAGGINQLLCQIRL